jgi:abortive infection bacteriophage resistance protein
VQYAKPAIPIPQQLALLQSRGLVITDTGEAERALARLSYYRLSAYFLSFQTPGDPTHAFRPGTTFTETLRLYEFDEELRLLVFRATGTVEIALRAQLAYQNSLLLGPHWYENPTASVSAYRFQENLNSLDKDLARASEIFLDHYRATYTNPQRPPSWMGLEVASFGLTSKFLNNLRSSPASVAIGAYFGVDEIVLKSWTRMMSYVRNVCAHHARLWNRTLTVKPKLPRRTAHRWLANPRISDDRLYSLLAVAAYLLTAIEPAIGQRFKRDLQALLQAYPTVPMTVMGFPVGWEQDAFWQ